MKAIVGIPVYNEEANISRLLEVLMSGLPRSVAKVLVISSGSTDNTNQIVESYCKRLPLISLIVEEERTGKASAMNIILREAEKFDAAVCLGGDNLPGDEAVGILLSELERGNAGIVGARPVPLNSKDKFVDWCVHAMWNLHHLISLKTPKISGELFGFKPGIVREIPPGLINDDGYLQVLFEMRGFRSVYLPHAKVYLTGPRTVGDFCRQRRRIFVGHAQIEILVGKKIPTFRWVRNLKWVNKAKPTKGLKSLLYFVGFLGLLGINWLLSNWDLLRLNFPYKWKISSTTKALRYGI